MDLHLINATMNMKPETATICQNLFHPCSIVVIGASSNPSKPGGRILKNILENDYEGILYAVNPKSLPIMNLPTYKTIHELPEAPELAIIAIPAPLVVDAMEQLAVKGVKTVIVLSAGFSEAGIEGKAAELRLKEIADENKMILIGPNCLGIMTPSYVGKFAGIVPDLKKGTVDLITCSGATGDQLIEQASIRGLSLSNMLTTGNSVQMGVEDILELMDHNFDSESSRILMLYMESVRKPSKLLTHARSLHQKGCIILGIKSGVTSAGKRAASSHTGAIVTNDTAVDALFEKSGIIRVESKAELIDIASVLSITRGPLQRKKACIITDAGGPGVMLSDELNRQGLECPVLGEQTQKRLAEVLPPQSPVANPIDCLPTRSGDQIKAILQILEEEEKENIDVIIIITSNSMLRDNWDTYSEIITGMNNKQGIPVIPVLSPGTTGIELINKFKSYGKIYFPDEVAVGKALGKVLNRPVLFTSDGDLEDYHSDKIQQILSERTGLLEPEIAANVLQAAGFTLPGQQEIFDKADLKSIGERIGFPWAMKVIGLVHKSDAGGVVVNISTLNEATDVWDRMMQIEGARGVLVQQMILGHEVILGTSREEGYGHLVMFGFGGIYTEIFKDVRFGLAPLTKKECIDMITSTKSSKIFDGFRGDKGMSIELMADYMVRLGRLVTDHPQIAEIDLNPLKGFDRELYAVDARIILD